MKGDRQAYWDANADAYTFAHPLELHRHVSAPSAA